MRAITYLLSLATLLIITPQIAASTSYQQEQYVLGSPSPERHTGEVTPHSAPRDLDFTLRHIYHAGSHKYPGLLRKVDVRPETLFKQDSLAAEGISSDTRLRISSRATKIERMVDRRHVTINSILDAGTSSGTAPFLAPSAWTVDDVPGPNVSDKGSILALAYMASNAYVLLPGGGEWEEVKGRFNYTEDFGWEEDGLRGHIFADTTNSTIVIGLKGTSMAIFDGAETTGKDKTNDNLFASCCCGQGGPYFWKQVCDCQTSTYTCNNTCLTKSLREKSHYYHAAKDLYQNVTERYPGADIWMTGHSLGGVVSSLLGLTYGIPVVTFEAYPDALAAGRLGLPTPPGYHTGRHQDRALTGVYHVGHTADPVFMGSCNTASSSCTLAGYAMQSQCHTGNVCTYDTVGDLGWRVGIGTHRISAVISDVIKKYDDVPECEFEDSCVDCFNWKFYESNGTDRTTSAPTSTKTSRTSTRTATCQTPGWWGCLDGTTSKAVTQTSTVTTTTCLTPGWFGCKDEATTTYTTTIITSAPASAPTVTTIPATTTTTTTSAVSASAPSSTNALPSKTASKTKTSATSTTCTSKEWFGLICVDPSPDASLSKTDL